MGFLAVLLEVHEGNLVFWRVLIGFNGKKMFFEDFNEGLRGFNGDFRGILLGADQTLAVKKYQRLFDTHRFAQAAASYLAANLLHRKHCKKKQGKKQEAQKQTLEIKKGNTNKKQKP